MQHFAQVPDGNPVTACIATGLCLDSVAVARLAQAARPLVRVLTDDQKCAAQELARKMGLMHILAELR